MHGLRAARVQQPRLDAALPQLETSVQVTWTDPAAVFLEPGAPAPTSGLPMPVPTAAEAGDRKSFFAADRMFHALLLEHGLGARAAAIGLHLRDQSRTADAAEAPGSPKDAVSAAQLVELVELVGEGRSAEARALVEENLGYFEG